MAQIARRISAPVGTRNSQSVMPNLPADLSVITELFDRIPVSQGGSAEVGGVWASDRNALIAEVTAQIITFQTANGRPTIDGVIDPGGGTLKLMNQLASDPLPGVISAAVVPAPQGFKEDAGGPFGIFVVDVNLMPGLRPIEPMVVSSDYIRKLVRVEGCSITWFGVVVPRSCAANGAVPHINFTPTPNQGGYSDATYDSFGGWGQLWADYTSVIGGQVAAATDANQIVVIPFYRTSQQRDLGDFLASWREVVAEVVTTALLSINPYMLRKTFTFDRIVSSSFSNGWVAHNNFNTQAAGAAAMTTVLFDLDGVAGGSNWQPSNGVIYQNRTAPGNHNPRGNVWYVGGRWGGRFAPIYPGGINTHAASRNHLLYHGVFAYC